MNYDRLSPQEVVAQYTRICINSQDRPDPQQHDLAKYLEYAIIDSRAFKKAYAMFRPLKPFTNKSTGIF